MEPAGCHVVSFEGKHISLDENVLPVNARDWSEDLAHHIAEIDSLALDDCF